MRYRNKVTGNILVTDCAISGNDFELMDVPEVKKEEPKKAPVKETKPKTTTTAKRAKK